MNQVIISLKPEYGELVLSGSKTVELRNRVVRIESGTTLWIYVTRPVGKIVAQARVRSVVYDSPPAIWTRYCEQMCIDQEGFADYVGGRDQVSALVLEDVRKMDTPITVGSIRRVVGAFHPPQFYARITPGSGLFRALNGQPGVLRR